MLFDVLLIVMAAAGAAYCWCQHARWQRAEDRIKTRFADIVARDAGLDLRLNALWSEAVGGQITHGTVPMSDRMPADVKPAWDAFREVVNMTPEELRAWLLTGTSDDDVLPGDPKVRLPELGRQVVRLLHKSKANLTSADAQVMRQVTGYVAGQRAEPPPDGAGDDLWRRALMTVGHDPRKPWGSDGGDAYCGGS